MTFALTLTSDFSIFSVRFHFQHSLGRRKEPRALGADRVRRGKAGVCVARAETLAIDLPFPRGGHISALSLDSS